MSKANARDWHQQQKQEERLSQTKEEQLELLYYAANKRKSGYPSVSTLRAVGLVAAADKLEEGYQLIEEAFRIAQGTVSSGDNPEA